jgi:SAM-dependent methyltransferase
MTDVNLNRFKNEFLNYKEKRISFWNNIYAGSVKSLGKYYHQKINDIYRTIIPENARLLELGCGSGDLLAALKPIYGVGIDFSKNAIKKASPHYPNLQFLILDAHEIEDLKCSEPFEYIVLSDLINDLWDVQEVFEKLKGVCNTNTRIVINYHSNLWNIPLRIARSFSLATPNLRQNWLTPHDLENLLEISGYQVLHKSQEIIFPIYLPFISNFLNRYVARISPFRFFDITNFMVARPLMKQEDSKPLLTVVIPARNESGNINEILHRTPKLPGGVEIIFVEGNSTDDTYAVIEKVIKENPGLNTRLIKQLGKGKGDAVRAAFDIARGEVLLILDADITVPPEDIYRFYDLIANNSAEFVNGVRLVYPMDDQAMRLANLIGNKFFSWAFSWLLGQPIRDTLCGTKVLRKSSYQKIVSNRTYFGDFDPFGDFDLLFGAAKLNLKILEVPIRYRSRKYGETNISRWSHGWLLLKMVIFAAKKIKFT